MNCERRRGVAEQTAILLGRNTAIPCQSVLAIKSQIEMEVWWKPISFVIHKVAMTTNEGCLRRIYPGSQRKSLSLWTHASQSCSGTWGRGPARRTFPGESNVLPGFSVNENWLGKVIRCGTQTAGSLSPHPFWQMFFFFRCKSSLISPY